MSKEIVEKCKEGYRLFDVSARLTERRIINLFGEVNEQSVNDLIQQIIYLNEKDRESEITMLINSKGGDIEQGFALCDVMELSEAPIRTIAIGTVASMASVIFLHGKWKEMLPSSKIMIHDPRVFTSSSVLTVSAAESLGEELKKMKDTVNKIISLKTGRPIELVNEFTKEEHCFDAEEACRCGLCDDIVKEF